MTYTAEEVRLALENLQMPPSVRGMIEYLATLLEQKPVGENAESCIREIYVPAGLHDETKKLVCGFAGALALKLYGAQKKYGYSDGWSSAEWMDECRAKLIEHLAKGDPRDVAAYCAFLWHHNESTAAAHPATVPDGWKLVPIVPTEEMVRAGGECWMMSSHNASGYWDSMLAAVPHPATVPNAKPIGSPLPPHMHTKAIGEYLKGKP
ncbi:MAG: hypothetical protein JO253_06390 [Alphaproteobacteria bacterium]|nr:hypothetical protein [Alphaproteobacteria bacterium]